ncbi:MAG: GNAT family N-acetyltransferase [Owenweeksia sp.]
MPGPIYISKDKDKLDIPFIHAFLTQSYWAEGRTVEEVKTTIENSVCYGLYKAERQIGFARVLTDKAVFAYIMDVFVEEGERGKGYAFQLIDFIMNDKELASVPRWMLGTRDAHPLYRKFGFSEVPNPNWVMGLKKPI